MNRNILLDLCGILVLGLVVLGGYQYSRGTQVRQELRIPVESQCDLQRRPCTVALEGGGSIELGLTPRPVPMTAPFQVEVRVVGLAPSQVSVEFTGVGMNMGENRVILEAAAPGLYRGRAELSVCVSGRMTWRATVQVDTPTHRIAAPFEFVMAKAAA